MSIKICLDAGHDGQYNRSSVLPAYYESDFNWKLHLKLKKELEAYGIQVITTRANQNVEMGTKSRGRLGQGCTLLLSIHSNAADRESADYPLVIVPISGAGDAIGKKLAACVKEVMETKEPADMWNKKSDSGNDWYGVINGAAQVGVPGIIIEHSFYTNKRMAEWMMVDSNLDKLAKAEADVIAAHYGISKPAKPEPTPTPTPAPSSTFKVGDIVSIIEGAVYTTGAKVPSWVREKQWIIKSISGSVAVIDKSADGKSSICSPIDVKYLVKQTPATPEVPTVKTYEVITTINRYNSEGNAKAKVNPSGTYAPGTYYIYNKYPDGSQGMLNITKDKTGNTPGSWINPSDNVIVAAPKPTPVPTPEVENKPEPAPEIKPEPEKTPNVEPAPTPEPKPEVKPEPEQTPTPEVETKPAPEVESKPEPAPEVKHDPEPTPEIKEDDTNPVPEESIPETEPAPEEQEEPKPEIVPEPLPSEPENNNTEIPSDDTIIGNILLKLLVEYIIKPLFNFIKNLFKGGK